MKTLSELPRVNPVSDLWSWRRLGHGSLFADFGHLVVTLTRGAEILSLLGGVVTGKCDLVTHAEYGDEVIGDRRRDETTKGFGKLTVVSLVPCGPSRGKCGRTVMR